MDKGIIFSAAMVRALLDGRKGQTRRLIKPQPVDTVTSAGNYSNSREGVTNQWSWLSGDPRDCDTWGFEGEFKVPYAPGDRLYVREAAQQVGEGYLTIYRADYLACVPAHFEGVPTLEELKTPWRPSIHMPRAWSRMWLLVTDVRVQRVAEISASDCYAEGIERPAGPFLGSYKCAIDNARNGFRTLWNSLHAKPGETWEDNPWIVAVSFECRRSNIDSIPA